MKKDHKRPTRGLSANSGQRAKSSATIAALEGCVRQHAFELYLEHGKAPGRDLENWLQAEREVKALVLSNGKRELS